MTTSVNIANRALLMLGKRAVITSLTQDSIEANAVNSIYIDIQNWCLGLANWNFARYVALLTQVKSFTTGGWAAGTSPAPPWLYEYSLPSGFIKAQYLTNSAENSGNTAYLGEPQRFVIATDIIATVQQEVLLTNQSVAILIYTGAISDPTLWTPYFTRLMVTALAWNLSAVLAGNAEVVALLERETNKMFMIAEQANREEGLMLGDTTPEWISAIGIPYPQRRQDNRVKPQQGQSSDNSR